MNKNFIPPTSLTTIDFLLFFCNMITVFKVFEYEIKEKKNYNFTNIHCSLNIYIFFLCIEYCTYKS